MSSIAIPWRRNTTPTLDGTAWCSPIRRSRDRSTMRRPPRTCSRIVKTKKTELLFLALFLRLLKVGGRAAVIVPDGVLFGSSRAHQELRPMLVEDHKLDAVIKLPLIEAVDPGALIADKARSTPTPSSPP